MMKQDEFEEIFKKYLRLKGYTQGRLARELHVDPSTINKWIKGINAIPYETVGELCALLVLEGREREEFFEAAGYHLPSIRPDRSPRSSPMVEDLPPGYVPRPLEFGALKDSLLREGHGRLTAMTSALKGAGGYGKTTLAQALCHDQDIRRAFPDGIEWVTLGEAPSTGELVAKIKGLIYRLSQASPPVESLEVAVAELRATLEERCLLLVLDDAWRTPDLKPFLQGGPRCSRLVTTRDEGVLPPDVPCVPVDAMRPEEAVQLLYTGMGPIEDLKQYEQGFYKLVQRLKEWPLLLALANGILRNRVRRHRQTVPDALIYINHALDKRGLVAFDPSRSQERHDAAARTLEVSFALLDETDYARYQRLAIFPEDALIPLDVVHRCWRTVGELDELDAVDSCLRLHELSLLRSYDLTARRARLHDVVRGYLRTKVGNSLPTFQQQFLGTYSVSRWADLPSSEDYLWKYLIPHLVETRQTQPLLKTITDLRYLAKKVYVQHSAYAAEADIELAERAAPSESRLPILKRQLARVGDLLYACETLQEVESTLLGQVCHLEELSDACQVCQREISRPFLMPWHLLPDTRATALIRTLHGHAGPVHDCAISPDGTWIVSASADKTLKLWDVRTGNMRFTLEGHSAPVTCCAISPMGNRVVSGSEDGTVRIWNAYSGNELLTLSGHKGAVTDCAISPDGAWIVSASVDKTLRLWDVHTMNELPGHQKYSGSVVHTLRGHKGPVTSCAISPDGTWIVSSSEDQTLRIWDARAGAQLPPSIEVEQDDTLYGCAISPDGAWLASTSDLGLKVWDVRTRTERFTTYGHVGTAVACAISPDGTWMLSTSLDDTVRGWRADTGLDVFIFKGQAAGVNGCAISPDGQWVVSASEDHTLKLWNVPTAMEERLPDEEEYAFGLYGCAIDPSGAWAVSVSLNGEMKRWDTHTGAEQPTLTNAAESSKCAISPDGIWVAAASRDHTLKTWDFLTGAELLTFLGHVGAINACAISPDGRWIVSASDDHTLKTWNAHTGAELLTFSGHTGAVNACAISPDGTWIISASSDQTLKAWDARTGNMRHTFLGHTGALRSCAITPTGDKIVSGSDDRTVRIWNASAPTEPPIILKHTSEVQGCALNALGNIIVAISGAHIKLWDMPSGRSLTTFYAHDVFSDCAFHPDGSHLVAAAESGLYFLRIVWQTDPV
jgi:WD40 repeat protein/transcriptional regulator with XRE-family HTH domain